MLRIYNFESENRAVIFASSLWSNHNNRGIWSDIESFVQAVMSKFPYLSEMMPSSTWISHSGQFSYESTWTETFHQDHFREMSVTLDNKNSFEIQELEILEKETVLQLINNIPFEATIDILKQLKHDNGWEGVVDDNQIETCWELKNGLVFGQIKETGLVN